MTDKVVVLVTCGTRREAQRIALRLVQKSLAACVNVLDAPVRSTYRWKEKVEKAAEYLLLIKTSRKLLPALTAEVKRAHSYALPEVIALPVVRGSADYLRWLENCLRPVSKRSRKGTRPQSTKKRK